MSEEDTKNWCIDLGRSVPYKKKSERGRFVLLCCQPECTKRGRCFNAVINYEVDASGTKRIAPPSSGEENFGTDQEAECFSRDIFSSPPPYTFFGKKEM